MPGIIVDPVLGTGRTQIILDPSAVADADRIELDLNNGAFNVAPDGPDWGDAAIAAAMSDARIGSSPVDYRIPNREVKIPLLAGADPNADYEAARLALTSKVALIQREGGWLKRDDQERDPVYLDVVNATLTFPDRYSHLAVEEGVVLTLECLPDFYGDEDEATVTGGDTGNGEWLGLIADMTGDHPARTRIAVTDLSGNDQLGLLYGIRSRHYDPASTAALVYEAENLTPLDAAAVVGGSVEHASLAADWTPVLSTEHAVDGDLTHVGSYRLWARVSTGSATPPSLRFLYDVGDFTAPAQTDLTTVAIPGASNSYIVDLGEVRIDKVLTGTHRWKGVIQGKGVTGGEDVSIDKLWLQPLDEGAGVVRYVLDSDPGLASYVARDEFNQTAGALSGKTLPVGGAWAGAGDTDDFAVSGTGDVARSAVSDTSVTAGRFALAGTTSFTDVIVQVDIKANFGANNLADGVLARYVDANNWLFAGVQIVGNPSLVQFSTVVWKCVGGVSTQIELIDPHGAPYVVDTYKTVRLKVGADGTYFLWVYAAGTIPTLVAAGSDSALATGGALASGKVGIYDTNNTVATPTRTFDNFAAWVPAADAVLFADQSAELRHDGITRASADGAAHGPMSSVVGDLPRLPPSGAENRPVEILLVPSRGDFDQLPDSGGTDALAVTVNARPTWLFRP
jgi:hypothetical protein